MMETGAMFCASPKASSGNNSSGSFTIRSSPMHCSRLRSIRYVQNYLGFRTMLLNQDHLKAFFLADHVFEPRSS